VHHPLQLSVLGQIIHYEDFDVRNYDPLLEPVVPGEEEVNDALEQMAEHDPGAQAPDIMPEPVEPVDGDASSSVASSPKRKVDHDATSSRPVKRRNY